MEDGRSKESADMACLKGTGGTKKRRRERRSQPTVMDGCRSRHSRSPCWGIAVSALLLEVAVAVMSESNSNSDNYRGRTCQCRRGCYRRHKACSDR